MRYEVNIRCFAVFKYYLFIYLLSISSIILKTLSNALIKYNKLWTLPGHELQLLDHHSLFVDGLFLHLLLHSCQHLLTMHSLLLIQLQYISKTLVWSKWSFLYNFWFRFSQGQGPQPTYFSPPPPSPPFPFFKIFPLRVNVWGGG